MDKSKWKVVAIAETIVIAIVVIFVIGFMAGRGKNSTTKTGATVANNETGSVASETTSVVNETIADNATKEDATKDESKKDSVQIFEVDAKEGLTASFKQSAKWGDEKKYYFQYDMTLENKSGADIENWAIKVPVTEDLELASFWNAKCVVADGYLYISPMEYSTKIEAGAKKTDVGIQMSSKSEPTFDAAVVGTMGKTTTVEPADKSNATNDATKKDGTSDAKKEGESALKTGVKGEYFGKLSVKGNKLVNAKGEQVQLHGVSTHGLGWFPEYVNKEAFADLQGYGANVVRLAMYTAENSGYCTDGDKNQLKQVVKSGVEYATLLDMYAIIDWHILSDNNPNNYKTQAIEFFDEMSKLYASNDHVIYEICNEPNSGTSWAEVKKYAQEVIPVIRKNDADAIILVGTPTWCQDVDQVINDPITGYDNIMYVVHFYAATHKDDIRNKMTKAMDAGIPVFVSEFSICDASGNGGLDYDSANKWLDVLNKYGISYVGWNLSNKDESSSILKAGCEKKSGFTQDDFSDSGKWLLESFQ